MELGRSTVISPALLPQCSTQIDRMHLTQPPLSGWSCLTPAFPTSPRQQRLILPTHPSARPTPASYKTTAMCRKCWIFCRRQWRARSYTASLVPPSSFSGLHWERVCGEHFFLTKRTVSFIACQDDRKAIRLLSVLIQTAVQPMATSAHTDLLKHTHYCAQNFWSLEQ